ncbi:hypothetical protein SCHIN_v1c10240 [Spiroplasma chinense]|uniref:Lipoprotein n=1 Tax=Spiroplasma chinense TaxID=216932 RepID=A0A5B9Y7C7_9MOLU|nr:lipoprotein [Spiroplasma chinense]QEH62217.1 hypothetical protein SCHIN_v1c10240 [Spiroplasma chinense]
MKKLLSLFVATSLVATSSSITIACAQKIKNLTMVEEKSESDLLLNLHELIENKKVERDLNDTKVGDFTIGPIQVKTKGKIQGELIALLGVELEGVNDNISINEELFTFFQESKDLKPEVSLQTFESTTYFFSAKGKKEATSFELFLGKMSSSFKGSNLLNVVITYKTLNKFKVNISQ